MMLECALWFLTKQSAAGAGRTASLLTARLGRKTPDAEDKHEDGEHKDQVFTIHRFAKTKAADSAYLSEA